MNPWQPHSTTTPLDALGDRGQSVWLDFISRKLVESGGLEELVSQRHVTGLTSNPTIFAKAIAEGIGYDDQLDTLLTGGMTDPDLLYIEVTATDIQGAADVLRPVYEATQGKDGFVSIEVPPFVAHDTAATLAIGRFLWERVDRPNVLVKVPATVEGIPAIEQLVTSGVNVNVTLIFALSSYEAVIEAYLRGLEARQRAKLPLEVHSVASFFVSRVDTVVDRLLEERIGRHRSDDQARSLLGTAAIANARLAYAAFEKAFAGNRFRSLREAGATVQRPLWASTSAKNPAYRDVVYAEALIGPDTIDTMPLATLEAFAAHGIVGGDTVREGAAEAREHLQRLSSVGIDFDRVTQRLLDDGVESFADSYNAAVSVITDKVRRRRSEMPVAP